MLEEPHQVRTVNDWWVMSKQQATQLVKPDTYDRSMVEMLAALFVEWMLELTTSRLADGAGPVTLSSLMYLIMLF